MSVDAMEEALSELLAAVLSPRAERMTNAILETLPPEVRGELRAMQEALAAVAVYAVDPVEPSPAVRARLLQTVASNAAKRRAPKRALVVVDMLNDHLTPGRPFEIPRARAVVPAIAKRIDEARASLSCTSATTTIRTTPISTSGRSTTSTAPTAPKCGPSSRRSRATTSSTNRR